MAVEIKYVVVRNGEEKMTFATKKEADAYDRMLDLADALTGLLQQGPVALDEAQQEALAMYLAQQKDRLLQVLRGGKVSDNSAADTGTDPAGVKISHGKLRSHLSWNLRLRGIPDVHPCHGFSARRSGNLSQ